MKIGGFFFAPQTTNEPEHNCIADMRETRTKKGPETFWVLRTNGGNRGCVHSLY